MVPRFHKGLARVNNGNGVVLRHSTQLVEHKLAELQQMEESKQEEL